MKNLFQVLYTLLLLLIKGFVLCQLWSWFIIPLGASINPPIIIPSLLFPISVGIVSIYALVNHLPIWHFKDYNEEFKYNVTIGMKPIVLLVFGWILHFFI
jgi:hypothetical protein